MPLYLRYLLRHIAWPFFTITITLTGILWLTQALRYVDLIVNRGVSVLKFIEIASLLLPALLYIILPIALLCAVIYSYQKLIMDSELVVLQGAGLSPFRLALPTFVLAGMLCAVSFAFSLYVLPTSYRSFKDMQSFIRSNYMAVLLQEGVFTPLSSTLTVYIDRRTSEGLLKGILVHDQLNREQPITMMAEEGQLVSTSSGPRFDMQNGSRQTLNHKTGAVTTLYFDRYAMDISLYTKEEGLRSREPEERYLSELFSVDDLPEKMRGRFVAEGHHRLVWPVLSLVLPLLSVTVLLRGDFNRRGLTKRIFLAVICALAIVFVDLIGKFLTQNFPMVAIVLYANVLLTLGSVLWLLSPLAPKQVAPFVFLFRRGRR